MKIHSLLLAIFILPAIQLSAQTTVQPKDRFELKDIILKAIRNKGIEVDLNFIDVSQVTNMSRLFTPSNNLENFNGDISQWDVSNVKNMKLMFAWSDFNGDISNWDVSNVSNMTSMFYKSKFNGDISNWDVNISVENELNTMFSYSPLYYSPPKWYKQWYQIAFEESWEDEGPGRFDHIVTATSGLSLREKPNLNATKIGSLPYQMRLKVYEKSKNTETIEGITAPWYQIDGYRMDNGHFMEGWVWGGYIKKISK